MWLADLGSKFKKSEVELANDQHEAKCRDPSCKRCLYVRNKDKWLIDLPLLPGQLRPLAKDMGIKASGSWVGEKISNGVWGVGCVCCSKRGETESGDAGRKTPNAARSFADFLITAPQKSTLVRHAQLPFHIESVELAVGIRKNVHDVPLAPSRAHFEQVWLFVEKGNAPSAGLDGVGGGKKLIRMIHALAEGVRCIYRGFMKTATMYGVRRDERATRLRCHFVACRSSDLEICQGVLGVARGTVNSKQVFGGSQITEASRDILNIFCTPKHNMQPWLGFDGIDQDLKGVMEKAWTSLTIDAAADEQLSARQTTQTVTTLDKAHASRRITSRTFKVDPLFKTVLDSMVVGKRSICSMIHHSLHIREVFRSNVMSECVASADEGDDDDSDVEDDQPDAAFNVGVALHRFDSLSKRLGRMTRKIDALVKTAEWIMLFRTGKKEAAQVRDFFGTVERPDILGHRWHG